MLKRKKPPPPPDAGPFRAKVRIDPKDDFGALLAAGGLTAVPPWGEDRPLEARDLRMYRGEPYDVELHAFELAGELTEPSSVDFKDACRAFARLCYRPGSGHEMLKLLATHPRVGERLRGVWSLCGPVRDGDRYAFHFMHRPGSEPERSLGMTKVASAGGRPALHWGPYHLFVGVPLWPHVQPPRFARFGGR